tara:strand:+ start:211 stop:465 length:255 start_codon:yes stop_codon:yes gene_type:complete
MIQKTEDVTWIPPVNEEGTTKPALGWLQIGGKIWQIINWHSFDDLGATIETLTIERGNQVDQSKRETKEIYSFDEGETFTFDIE